MANAKKVYIFHIHRQDGSSLMLHPLAPAARVVPMLEGGPLEGRYGTEPRVEALTGFRDELYRQVELGVRHWMADRRFVPKFLLAAGAFVALYLFFSIVVRDPLPVIDEVALGLVGAVVSFVLLGRRDLASRPASRKRLDLRMVVDRITFRESEFVKRVEQALHRAEGQNVVQVVRRILEPLAQGQESPEGDPEEAEQFLGLLEQRFNFRKLEREESGLRRLAGRREAARLLAIRKVDFPLYAVYKGLKRTVSARR